MQQIRFAISSDAITSLTVPNRIILCAMERITPIVDNLYTGNPPFHILRERVMLNHPESE